MAIAKVVEEELDSEADLYIGSVGIVRKVAVASNIGAVVHEVAVVMMVAVEIGDLRVCMAVER